MRYDAATPTILLIADDTLGRMEGEALAAAVGAAVVTATPSEAAPLIESKRHQAILVHLAQDGGAETDRLLTALEAAARAGDRGIVLAAPPPLFDLAMALAPHPTIALVAAGDGLGQAAALGLALAQGATGLAEGPPTFVRENRPPSDLRRLSEEAARIAQMLASLAGASWTPIAERNGLSAEPLPPEPQRLRRMIQERRLRDRFFAPDLFADPAWDMLLDLTAARLEEVNVSVSSLCIAAAVPPTTALRWIKSLTEQGLVERVADPDDQRRIFIGLSDEGFARMCAYLGAVDARR